MSWKKFLCGAMAASMIFSASIFCSAAGESANEKLARIEIDTYGTEQSGAILDRISRLEKSYSGRNMDGNMNARIEAIYDVLYDNSEGVGVLAKINVLEWYVNHETAVGGIDLRLITLENQILGRGLQGTFNERIRALAKASYGAEILPMAPVQVPANTLIKVETTAPVSSKILQEGDVIPIKVVEDVFVDGNLVFVRGLPGEGVVTEVRRAKNIFSNGKIETNFCRLKSLDGRDVNTFTGVESLEMMANNSMARGLSLIGQTFSGKNRGVEEVFIRGKNIDLPEGIALYIQLKEPVVVYGLRQKSNVYGGTQRSMPAVDTEIIPSEEIIEMNPGQEPPPLTSEEMIEIYPESTTSDEVEVYLEPEVEESRPAPPDDPAVESRPDEGKTLEGYDGEIIEIIDD